jgi:flavodoxin I
MKTLIVYSSKTGNTKKLAEAANNFIGGEKNICPVGEAPDPGGFDLVVVGFWLMAGKPDPQSSDFLATVGRTTVFLMATHGAAADSEHARKAMEHAKSLAAPAQVAGTFNCQGEVSPAFLEKAAQKDPQPPWIGDAPAAAGHPDHNDIDRLAQVLKSSLPQFVA